MYVYTYICLYIHTMNYEVDDVCKQIKTEH